MYFPICTAVIVDECGGEPVQHIPLSLFWAKGGILDLKLLLFLLDISIE